MAEEDRGGDELTLEYPKGLLPSEHAEAERRIAHLPRGVGHELLDELAARLKAGTIRVSPLVYLLELIKRADAGTFAPEAGLRVADARDRRRRNEAALRRIDDASILQVSDAGAVEDNALVKRVAAIRVRNRKQNDKDG